MKTETKAYVYIATLAAALAACAPASARDGELNIAIGQPGYYQPSYADRGYHNQSEWQAEQEARRNRAIEWRDHHGNDDGAHRDGDRRGDRDHAQLERDRNHDNGGERRQREGDGH